MTASVMNEKRVQGVRGNEISLPSDTVDIQARTAVTPTPFVLPYYDPPSLLYRDRWNGPTRHDRRDEGSRKGAVPSLCALHEQRKSQASDYEPSDSRGVELVTGY